MTPQKYLRWMLQVLGLAALDFIRIRDLPEEPGPGGHPWKITETTLTHTLRGSIIRASLTCAIWQGAGDYTAVVRAYQVPTQRWREAHPWLPEVARSISVSDPARFDGLEGLPLPAPGGFEVFLTA